MTAPEPTTVLEQIDHEPPVSAVAPELWNPDAMADATGRLAVASLGSALAQGLPSFSGATPIPRVVDQQALAAGQSGLTNPRSTIAKAPFNGTSIADLATQEAHHNATRQVALDVLGQSRTDRAAPRLTNDPLFDAIEHPGTQILRVQNGALFKPQAGWTPESADLLVQRPAGLEMRPQVQLLTQPKQASTEEAGRAAFEVNHAQPLADDGADWINADVQSRDSNPAKEPAPWPSFAQTGDLPPNSDKAADVQGSFLSAGRDLTVYSGASAFSAQPADDLSDQPQGDHVATEAAWNLLSLSGGGALQLSGLSRDGSTAGPLAATVIHQTAVAIVSAPPDTSGRIELVLTPEDLGPLRFEMTPDGDELSIVLSAERSETLDLIRRHLPELLAELKNAGYHGGTLSFGQWSDRGQDRAQSAFDIRAQSDLPPPLVHPPAPAARSDRDLDLRL